MPFSLTQLLSRAKAGSIILQPKSFHFGTVYCPGCNPRIWHCTNVTFDSLSSRRERPDTAFMIRPGLVTASISRADRLRLRVIG